jgi:asparagine N-glycosylation enzyme membrane subunit Stt3
MREKTRAFLQRHSGPLGVVFVVVAGVVAAGASALLDLPKSYVRIAFGVAIVAFGAFYTWARTLQAKPEVPTPLPTIGQHMRRTRVVFQRISVPLVVAWCVAVTFYGSGMTELQKQGVAVGGGVALFLIMWLFIRKALRCPSCGTDFRRERIAKLGRFALDARGAEELWDACPRCHVNFNDPLPP